LKDLRWETVDILYGHLEYLMEIRDIWWPFGTFCVHLVHFSGFVIMYQEKSGNREASTLSDGEAKNYV
jgi:hypothetical protein